MEEIKIDKGIEMPAGVRRPMYPYRSLEIGDSFLIPGKVSGAVGGTVSYARRVTGFKFVTRTVEGGVRVWRIE